MSCVKALDKSIVILRLQAEGSPMEKHCPYNPSGSACGRAPSPYKGEAKTREAAKRCHPERSRGILRLCLFGCRGGQCSPALLITPEICGIVYHREICAKSFFNFFKKLFKKM